MKKEKVKIGLCSVFVIFLTTVGLAQRPTITKEKFEPLKQAKVNFKPYVASDFVKSGKVNEQDMITLPNKKKMPLKDYIAALNRIEKNLADIGIEQNSLKAPVVASRYKSIGKPVVKPMFKAGKGGGGTPISKTTVKTQYKLSNIGLSKRATEMYKIIDQLDDLKTPSADALPNESFNNDETSDFPEFKVADYGVTVSAKIIRNGTLDPFSLSNNRLHTDSLKKLIKKSNNEFILGLNVNISTDLPGVGDFNIYKLESQFTARANSGQKHKSKAKLQVLEQILLDDNRSINGDEFTYQQDAIYNTKRLLGSADIFNYGLNVLLPVDMYLNCTGVGAEFDIDITRTGVGGTITPIVTQSIIMETSATEALGPVADLLNVNIADIGVGGEIRLVQGGLDFGGNVGLAVKSGGLKFINETYNAASLKFLRGRLYTFYTYPVYTCDNIFGLATPSCYAQKRVENDFFDSGSFLELSQVIADEFNGKNLKWK